MVTAPSLAATVGLAKALAHPGRLRILAMLRGGELCVCQMTAVLRLATSTVSAHLSELRRAGFIVERKDARWVRYRLADDQTVKPLLDEALSLIAADGQIRSDAAVVRALRRIPVPTLCRAGLDLRAAGVRSPAARRTAPAPRPRTPAAEASHGD
jgi:ArsR family transcriptional regulator, arsenate/arsenite/antimonite-responsive transcriptional repressor